MNHKMSKQGLLPRYLNVSESLKVQVGLLASFSLLSGQVMTGPLLVLAFSLLTGSHDISRSTVRRDIIFDRRNCNHHRYNKIVLQASSTRSRPIKDEAALTPSSDPSSSSRRWQFHVAPMQGYTALPLRTLYSYLSPSDGDDDKGAAILWTEMEKVEDLLNANEDGWMRRFGPPQTTINGGIILQLGGSDPNLIKQCIQKAARYGYGAEHFRGINLNCGCPSIESGGAATYGASLMRRPELTGELVRAVREATNDAWGKENEVEVSVKTRIAALETPEDLTEDDMQLSEEKYASLHDYLTQIQAGGADHAILHARPAVLSGLSPVKNRIIPRLDYISISKRTSSSVRTPQWRSEYVSLANFAQYWSSSFSFGVSGPSFFSEP